MNVFVWPVRVYYEDTDSGGVVYYANYLRFMERARTEYLRSLGFEQDQLAAEEGVIFAVRALDVDYRKPARFNDLLTVTAQITRRGQASLVFEQQILREERDPAVLCSGRVKIACLDAATFTPTPIPSKLLTELPDEL